LAHIIMFCLAWYK